ncbi:hypothetical protein E3N88_39864 [Mikania micrantha]|uniref:U3 small nucleolar RNA-associated protein 10 N-terminal domain-containing protein n=1 Tax=Mikania micrantha TaxID=192012 RepID=A0A5N6LL71_9ASTR|nr:hypothetical protein E3N88_39864 [Mikania micrantha]
MATSIASQLQAIRSIVKVADTESNKRPFTRPSILFDAKEAADIDLDTLFNLALSALAGWRCGFGINQVCSFWYLSIWSNHKLDQPPDILVYAKSLTRLEILVSQDERFGNYKNDLFAHKSKELDRELMGIEENNQINASVSSYLRLLSGYFQLPSALRTLEYLIRRYKIHVYNIEELILCALPYHDTHVFVRIVQLLDTGHGKWMFLEGVKTSGAPPPRKVIVQQCVRDMGILEALCNYASPSKKVQPSRPVISFCTAVVIEVFGSLPVIDSDVVKRILPYLVSSLQSHSKGNIDHKNRTAASLTVTGQQPSLQVLLLLLRLNQRPRPLGEARLTKNAHGSPEELRLASSMIMAGALMIVGLLANRSTLSPNLVKSLIRSIVDVAREDTEHSTDLQLFRVSFMALVNVVQFQSIEVLPKKVVDILKEIRDLSGILFGLTKEFNVDKFMAILLESLMEYSSNDDGCHQVLLSIIETVPVNALVGRLVSKLLYTSMKLYKKGNETSSSSAPG